MKTYSKRYIVIANVIVGVVCIIIGQIVMRVILK